MKILLQSQKRLPAGNRAQLTYGVPGSFGSGCSKRQFHALQRLSQALQRVKLRLTDKTRLSFFCGVTVMRDNSVFHR
jgi:hypothetical protein